MHEPESPTHDLDEIGHPKGTLAVVLAYLLLFVLGWAGLYLWTFLPRGTPDAVPHHGAPPPSAEARPAPEAGP